MNFKKIAKNYDCEYGMNCNYSTLLSHFGKVLLEENYGSYQGDTLAIIKDKGKLGFLNFGWGSCSGCDALQACSTTEELANLMERLFNNIKWFDSLTELKTWVLEADEDRIDGFYRSEEEWKQFAKKVKNLKI